MFHQVYYPHPALRSFVNNITIFKHELDASLPLPSFSFPPLPEQCLYFYPLDSPLSEYLNLAKQVKLPQCIVVGPQVNLIKLSMPRVNFMIKVGFQPGGLYRFLNIPMQEFPLDEALNSMDILGKEVAWVNEQLASTQSFVQMKNIVESFLLKKTALTNDLPIDKVLPLVIKSAGAYAVDELAKLSCVSNRQLERQFLERIGVSPKFFIRQARFAKAWSLKENFPQIKWTRIAYECGYFDQMHLIKDFKNFCGVSPRVIEQEFKESPYLLKNQYGL